MKSFARTGAMFFVLGGVLAGCNTYVADRYAPSAENVTRIRALDASVNVGPFESFEPGLNTLTCRGAAPITTPSGETFAEFVRSALITELTFAEAYATGAPVTLTGRLDNIDFGSVSGHWLIALTVHSSNGRSFAVKERFEFPFSYVGDAACDGVADALMPAVQDTIRTVLNDPDFPALLSP